jgi:ABC-type phosphate/phosphonate transport system substrate-binding protein
MNIRRSLFKGVLAVTTAFSMAPLVAQAQTQTLKVTTIPEEAATEQIRKFGPIVKYLERVMGVKVEFIPVNDYPAAVEALVRRNCARTAKSFQSRNAKKIRNSVRYLLPTPIQASKR